MAPGIRETVATIRHAMDAKIHAARGRGVGAAVHDAFRSGHATAGAPTRHEGIDARPIILAHELLPGWSPPGI